MHHRYFSSISNVSRLILGIFFIVATASTLFSSSASAASLANWNPGNIISDGAMLNKNTMNASHIQSFLNSKVPVCYSSNLPCLKDYSQNGKSAAQIIYDASQTYTINPQVLLALIQKESGLITTTQPIATQYQSATGFGCPDTAACDTKYFGLTNQVQNAAKMFNAIMTANPNWYTPYVVGNNFIRYNPVVSCGGSNVNIQNRATQALYNYTPYQPNQAALNAGYGQASCGAYGNRNFFHFFTDWFGSTYTSVPYAWQVQSQAAFTSLGGAQYKEGVVLSPGQTAVLQVKAQNIGYKTWDSNVRLGPSKPSDRLSKFSNGAWLSSTRISMLESSVTPGSVGTFNISITAPVQPGTYDEYFNLLAEGETWMNDIGLYFTVDVVKRADKSRPETQMNAGDEIINQKYIQSSDRHSILTMQSDGNLVIYSDFKSRWSTNTSNSNAEKFVLQSDGNLVIYAKTGQPLWASGTSGNPGAFLRFQSDGNLVLYSPLGSPLWISNSGNNPDYYSRVVKQMPEASLYPGQSLETNDRKYVLVLQEDGNLVLYGNGKALWASTTSGKQISHLAMQKDGNLVLYDTVGSALWNSKTSGKGAASLVLQDDGNLVIYNTKGASWASNTRGM